MTPKKFDPKKLKEAIREEIDAQEQLLQLEISKVRLEIERSDLRGRLEDQRPCRMKWTRVVPLGDGRYECICGPDLDDGDEWKAKPGCIRAIGRTPEEAERNFDTLWIKGSE